MQEGPCPARLVAKLRRSAMVLVMGALGVQILKFQECLSQVNV